MNAVYDGAIKDKYRSGFGSQIGFHNKTEDQIAAMIIEWNNKTPHMPNRWKLAYKKEVVAA